MQAIVQDKYGSAEVLELREIEPPAIGDHEVLVRVRAAGVNPADWAVMSGLPYIARPATRTACAGQRTASGGRTSRGRSRPSAAP